MNDRGAWHCVEALGLLVSTGRSAEFGAARRGILRRAELERAAASSNPMARARALRLLGRKPQARRLWNRALARAATRAEALAGLWEMDLAARAGSGAALGDIEEAVRAAPRDARWRSYRALGLLLSRPRSEYGLAPRGINRIARSSSARGAASDALAEARAAVRLNPRFPLAPIAAALACEDLGRPREAAAWFGRASALAPREGWLKLARADARRRAGDLDGFVADAAAAHELDEGAASLRFAVADPRDDSVKAALAGAGRLLRRRPRAAWALALRADLKRFPEVNDFRGARADLERAARLAPRSGWIWAHLSRARLWEGDSDVASAAIARAARLSPGCGWIRAWHGAVLRRGGRPREALSELDIAVRSSPDYELAYAWRGGALLETGRPREALKDLSIAAALAPESASILVDLHRVLRALGRTGEALEVLSRARRLDPKSAWCSRPQETAAALAELDALLRLRPRDGLALAWRGETRLRAGDARGAVGDLGRAVKLDPRDGWSRVLHGRALAELGRRAAAGREFDAALRIEPDSAEALAWRGRLRLDAGRARSSLADLSRAAALEPRAAWIHSWEGEAALKARLWSRALAAFRQAAALERGDDRHVLGEARALLGAGRARAAAAPLRSLLARVAALTAAGRHDESAALASGLLLAVPRWREALAARGRPGAGSFQ